MKSESFHRQACDEFYVSLQQRNNMLMIMITNSINSYPQHIAERASLAVLISSFTKKVFVIIFALTR